MRVWITLAILALALLGTVFLTKTREGSFDARFERAEKQVRDLAEDIEQELAPDMENDDQPALEK